MRTPKKRSREIPTKNIERIARDASNNAIMNAFNCGISITRMQGDDIVRIYPDGSIEFIERLENSTVMPEKRLYRI
jgi:histone H3/H4